MHRTSDTIRTRSSSITETQSVEKLSPTIAPPPGKGNSSAIHNLNNEDDVSRRESQSESDAPTRLSQSTDGNPIPPTPTISPAPPPTQRPRVRRPATQEVGPPDSQSLIDLGMSPFMPVQNAIFNQNRLVRNEAILAQHVSRLQHSYSLSESNHAQRAQDIYRILTDHKASIDKHVATVNSTSVRLDPDFAALFDAHVETRIALNTLIRKFSSYTTSTKSSINQLNESIRRLTSGTSITATEDSVPASTTDSVQTEATPQPLHSASNFSLPEIADYSTRGIKRKRDGLNLEASQSTSIAASRAESPVNTPDVYPSRSDFTSSTGASKDVIYGPVNNANDHLNSMAVVNEAIRSVGLSPSMVQSILPAPGKPDFLSVRFLKYEYASRFVDLVAFGVDGQPSCQAFFADSSGGPALGVASSSKSKIW